MDKAPINNEVEENKKEADLINNFVQGPNGEMISYNTPEERKQIIEDLRDRDNR